MREMRPIKLAIFATHPVQYHVALWRALASHPELSVTVFYLSDMSVKGKIDPGFGVEVAWDIPLLDGYKYVFLTRNEDINKPYVRLKNFDKIRQNGPFDWVLIQGYNHLFELQVLNFAKRNAIKILIRGEFADIRRRSLLKGFIRRTYLNWFYSKITRFCFIGEKARQHLVSFGIAPERLYFSPYAVDSNLFEKYASNYDKVRSRQLIGIDNNKFVFLFSGKFIHRKAHLLLLDAIERIAALTDVALIMLGDGLLSDEVLRRGKSILRDNFIAPGFVNQSKLGPYFAAADAQVLPSYHETWGLVVNEGVYFGLPAIVSDHVGCYPDLVIPGVTGDIFSSGDCNSLAEKMLAFAMNRENTRVMGENAKALISRYGIDQAASGVLSAIGVDSKK